MPGPRQWGTQPRSVTRPQEALPLRPQGLSREQGESSAAGWLESGTRGLRGWGRPPRPPAPDPSLASGCPYRRLGAWAASPRKPLEDAPHNPGSREIGNTRRRAGGTSVSKLSPRPRADEAQSSGQRQKGLGAGGRAAFLPEFQARNYRRGRRLGTQCPRAAGGTQGPPRALTSPGCTAHVGPPRREHPLLRASAGTGGSEVDPLVPVGLVGEGAAQAERAVQRGLVEDHGAPARAGGRLCLSARRLREERGGRELSQLALLNAAEGFQALQMTQTDGFAGAFEDHVLCARSCSQNKHLNLALRDE